MQEMLMYFHLFIYYSILVSILSYFGVACLFFFLTEALYFAKSIQL